MFFFFHLFTGVVLGLLIGDLLSDRRWIIPCIIGAVLPDIIDKPLNFILDPAVNGNGRFLFHNLLVCALLMLIGLLLWIYYTSPIVLALDIGILSHQILDSMWMDPVRWLYPLLGPYPTNNTTPPDFIFSLLGSDLFNPSEWIIIVLLTLCALLYFEYRQKIVEDPKTRPILKGSLLICALICCILGGIWIGRGLARQPLAFTGYTNPVDYLMGGFIICLAAYVFWRLHQKI
jgi:membrane-bound metal-dependent hydrolase YbcI (DUF457 family)